MTRMDIKLLTGRSESHLSPLEGQAVQLHSEVIGAFRQLQHSAAQQGIELCVASGFRSFERQLAIWNGKASGQRPVLDSDGQVLDMTRLSPLEQVRAIMRWSALPGASRHHWGTDFDVWDKAAVASDYQLQLVTQEYQQGGPFATLDGWLQQQQSNFYRPYSTDRGGIAPEPWHLSYRPLAQQFASALTPQQLAVVLAQTDLALKQTVLDNLDALFEQFVRTENPKVESIG